MGKKAFNGNFIRGIKNGRCAAAGAHRVVGELQAGKAGTVGCFEVELQCFAEVGGCVHPRRTVGVEEAVLNRKGHGRRAELREDRAIDQLREGVDDALWMNDHFEAIWFQSKEPLCFD